MVDNLKFAANAADGAGVTVLVEPLNTRDVAGTYVYTSSHGRSLVESAASPIVKLQYDVYHMQIMEGDLAPTIDANMDVIHHFQLADNPGRNEPGTGEINYDFLLASHRRSRIRRMDRLRVSSPAGRTEDGLGWARKYL